VHDIEQTITLIRDSIRDLPERYEENHDEIGKLDQEQQDLLHFAEFKRLDIQRGFDFYKETKKLRVRRRELKNENELIAPVVDILTDYKKRLDELNRAIGAIRNKKKLQKDRHYTFKVRKDLGETIK